MGAIRYRIYANAGSEHARNRRRDRHPHHRLARCLFGLLLILSLLFRSGRSDSVRHPSPPALKRMLGGLLLAFVVVLSHRGRVPTLIIRTES